MPNNVLFGVEGSNSPQNAVKTANYSPKNTTYNSERVWMHSPAYAETLTRALVQRLTTATAKLTALTPPRGLGKRQSTDEVTLVAAAKAILQAMRRGFVDLPLRAPEVKRKEPLQCQAPKNQVIQFKVRT